MSNNLKGFTYVFLFSLAWALNVVLAGYTISELGVNPYVYGGQTLMTATILFVLYIIFKNSTQAKPLRLKKSHIIWLLLMGFVSNGIGNYFTLKGIAYSPTNFAFLIKTSVIFTFVTELLLGHQKFDKVRLGFIMLLLFGAYLISTKGEWVLPNIYDVYSIIAAACVGIVGAWSMSYINDNAPEYMALFRSLAGGVTLYIFAGVFDHTLGLDKLQYLWSGILGGVLVFLLFLFLYKLLEFKSASYSSMMSMMFSVMVLGLEYKLFGEILQTWQFVGAGIIIIAVVLLEMYSQQKEKK